MRSPQAPVSRPAFSMIEVVFAIVILGIVASIGSQMIVKVFEGYVVERAQYRASIKTELALNQIANRLRYAIPGTIISRPSKDSNSTTPITDIGSLTASNKVLQWVAYDGDSFEAITNNTNRKPGWSGFCDLAASTKSTIKTPGSHLTLADTIIKNLSHNSKSLADAVIYFPDGTTKSYGIDKQDDTTLKLDTNLSAGTTIYERYKLAWTSYALEVNSDNDLILHYKFAPTYAATINGSSSILLHHVTNFRFQGSESSIRVKICKEERIGGTTDANITSCKEKVIF